MTVPLPSPADHAAAIREALVYANNCHREEFDTQVPAPDWGSAMDSLAALVAQATLVAEQAEAAREALRLIQAWDCLNPPDKNLCHDHPWLKRLVDDALAHTGPTKAHEYAIDGFARIEKMADEAVATGYETREALAHALGLISGTALSRREALAGGDSR